MSYTEQLERDTERTRLELANTIEELRDRLTPGGVLDEVLDYAGDGDVGDYLRSFKRQIIDNPVPLGLMGASMAWLVVASAFGRRGGSRMMREHVARKAGDFAARARARGADFAEGAQAMGADLAGSAQAAGTDIANSARAAVHDLSDRAAELRADATNRGAEIAQDARAAAARVGDRMGDAASIASVSLGAAGESIADSASRSAEIISEVANEIGRNSRAASRAVSHFAHEQPLIVAAAGLVLGAIVGTLLPSTETEDRLIGDSSDAAKEKLRETVGEQYAKVKDVAMRTAEAAVSEHDEKDSSQDGAEPHASAEFAPGHGDHARAEQASADHSRGPEEAAHAGGA
jgi:hypothetical protein